VTLSWGEKDKCSMQEKCWERRGEMKAVLIGFWIYSVMSIFILYIGMWYDGAKGESKQW
jgi:hypothetical protein